MFDNFRNAFFVTFLCSMCPILEAAVINVATTVPPNVQNILKKTNMSEASDIINKTRRIINGVDSTTRPYMVYLQLPLNNPKYKEYRRWLCGGVIIHEEYILTSAACIEDARNFYVVSGTFKHYDDVTQPQNQCVKNGAKKAIWKCVPRNYVFDGHENDNIRWMNNDIAVVKVEDEFDFERRVRGCDYIPKPICYNNQTETLENPGNGGVIAGWGSTLHYNDWVNSNRRSFSGNVLKETTVQIISKNKCRRRWGTRYYNIIDNYMICTKDLVPDLSEVCEEKYVDCTDVMYSGDSDEKGRRFISPESLVLHSPYHNGTGRRVSYSSGGFCENDHGGPLIAGDDMNPVVIGVISACLVKERTNKCYGPFLYTSVYKNRVLLDCAIYKNKSPECSKMHRSSVTHTETDMSWVDHPDGPAKNEIAAIRRMEEARQLHAKRNVTSQVKKARNEAVTSGADVPSGTNVSSSMNFTGGMNVTDGANVTDEANATDAATVSSRENVSSTANVASGANLTSKQDEQTRIQVTRTIQEKSYEDRIGEHEGLVLRIE